MGRPADVQVALAQFLPAYQAAHPIDARRRQVLCHLGQCRTARLGGWVLRCEHCEREQMLYHACRDRHCPKCQQREARRWSERQGEDLLPVAYFHVVFTLPHTLNGWVQLHDRVLYSSLFTVAWSTLDTFARDPRRGLGGQLGMTAVMHTWGENLSRHVHLHCLIPGGVLREDGRWRSARGTYLFPVKALSRYFRGTMVRLLRAAAKRGELHRVHRDGEVEQTLTTLMTVPWVVYAKPCLTHTSAVLAYLARYTHRIAISDHRILDVDRTHVHFTYKDTRDGRTPRTMTLAGEEFVRRYLQHILPKGLMRIRHYGFLANRCRRQVLTQIRTALTAPTPAEPTQPDAPPPFSGLPCAGCTRGWMVIVVQLPAHRAPGTG